jgi:hypothetical protein
MTIKPLSDNLMELSLRVLLSGMEFILSKSHQRSLILLSRHLCNAGLERLFFGLWGDSSGDVAVTLSSAFAAQSRVYLQSASNLSLLSVDALDGLLSSESFVVDSADAFLRILLPFRHLPILRHVQLEFVSPAAIAILFEDPASYSLTESLGRAVADF